VKGKWLRLLWGTVFGLGASASIQSQTAWPRNDSSLVRHFDFEILSDKVISDASGYGNNGWQYNATNLLSPTLGVFGTKAVKFSYVGFVSNDFPRVYPFSQYIAVVTNLAGFAYLTNGTISLWSQFATNNDRGMYLLDNGYRVLFAPAASNSWTLGRLSTPHLPSSPIPRTAPPGLW